MALTYSDIDVKAVNTVRVLAADASAKANSGHPGAPMGLAPLAHVLFKDFIRANSGNPNWPGRDRFILSNGHACLLQYIFLHLLGYDLSIQDLKQFRQLHSKTPGHPENVSTPGIEVTTGPLGQGISNAVGLAIAERHLAATFNKPGFEIVDNYTYTIFGDGCAQEGVASEAASLAGHLKLNKLIAFYDQNNITIDGNTNVSFTEDVEKRFQAYGWHVLHVEEGNDNLEALAKVIEEAQKVKDKPTMIRVPTIIGYGSLQQGTHGVHGSPLKPDDIKQLKSKYGFNPDESFVIPKEVDDLYANKRKAGKDLEKAWNDLFARYSKEYPELAAEFERRVVKRNLPKDWEKALPTYTPADPAVATRKLSETVLTKIEKALPELIGGSADLTGSNLTRWKDAVDFQPPSTGLGDWTGRYIRYGVREHGMGAVMNGISAYGGLIPYGGTFLNFVSYAGGSVRLSAISQVRNIWVATHDSIGLGEDGPTHQPVETLTHFRSLPNMSVWRPADGNETSAAYKVAVTSDHTPTIIALSRQNLPQLEGSSIEKASKGGYILKEVADADVYIVSTGSEVSIAVEAAKLLDSKGIKTGLISLPDWHTFNQQSKEYQLSVFPDGVPILSFEALSTAGWQRYSHEQFGLNRFGESGPYKEVYDYFNFNPEGVAERAEATVKFYKGHKVRSPLNKAFLDKL